MTEQNPFRIDENRLDRECLNHPKNVYDYMIELAKAKLVAEEASQEYDLIKADLDKKIRDRPERYKLSKITETAVHNAMRATQEYQDAKEHKAKKAYEVDVLQAAVTALVHKRDMLSNLIQLRKMEYFSEPLVDQDDVKEIKKSVARSKGGVK